MIMLITILLDASIESFNPRDLYTGAFLADLLLTVAILYYKDHN